ncbi:MAG TPA: RluA family pseudouridine synthase [Myxococcales bacterium LLY-WYZ-16_1]|nr:RluA family pseudouridine synthase [Myxococcales bacterium LLY-WYZ-16_1]
MNGPELDLEEEEDDDGSAAGARTVGPEYAGLRLDHFLVVCWPERSRSALQRHVEAGAVTIDGSAPVRGVKTRVRTGQVVRYAPPAPRPWSWTPEAIPLRILYEDDDVLVVDKEAGRVVHPAPGHTEHTLLHGILHHMGQLPGGGTADRPGIVHRLDRDTTGVMVVAKTEMAHGRLADAFSRRDVEKRYVAVVLGCPRPERGGFDTWYGRDPRERKKFSSRVGSGKRARTRYAVQATYGLASRVDVDLDTGRTHQIRVHFADAGHPLVGDATYGGRRWVRFRQQHPKLDFARPALHARRLVFPHPRTGSRVDLSAPLPKDLQELLDRLEARA